MKSKLKSINSRSFFYFRQLTWQEVILRFLMNCRLWFCTFCGILKQKLLFITGRRSQSFGCAEGCHHTSDSSLPNRKSSSGSSRGRRSRDEQELESDEDEDNANISDVSEEEAEETAGSSIEETEDYVHRQVRKFHSRESGEKRDKKSFSLVKYFLSRF